MDPFSIIAIVMAAVGTIASVVSPVIQNKMQNSANKLNYEKYNSPTAQSSALRKAGLSPLINGGYSFAPVSNNVSSPDLSGFQNLGTNFSDIVNSSKLTKSQIGNMDAAASYTKSQQEIADILKRYTANEQEAKIDNIRHSTSQLSALTGLTLNQSDESLLQQKLLIANEQLIKKQISKSDYEMSLIQAQISAAHSSISLQQAQTALVNAQKDISLTDAYYRDDFNVTMIDGMKFQNKLTENEVKQVTKDIEFTDAQIKQIIAETGLSQAQAEWYARNQVAAIVLNTLGTGADVIRSVRRGPSPKQHLTRKKR